MQGTRLPRTGLFRALCASLAGVLVLAGGHASANDASDSDALITRGLALRQKSEDRQALPLFQEAVEKRKTPRAIAQLGLCELALGLWVEADGHLTQALASPADPWIHKNERALATAHDGIQQKLGFLDIWGEPAAARVAVDGHAVGALPLERPLRLTTGRHSLLIEAKGFLSDNRFVDIPARSVAREHVALAPVPVLAQPQPPAPLPSLSPPPAQPLATVVEAPASSAESAKADAAAPEPVYKRWWFWTAIGVAALAAGGTIFLVSRKDHCESSGGSACVAW